MDWLMHIFGGSRMEELDYPKLLGQLLHVEGPKLARYFNRDGNLIIAEKPYLESIGLNACKPVTVLEADLHRVAREIEDLLPAVAALDPVRQRVVVHMAFNMGVTGLLAMIRFVAAVGFHFWETAAQEMLISQWAKEGKRRATALVEMMRTGEDDQISVPQPRTA
jgi:lysozyme